MAEPLKVGLAGLGTVGTAVIQLLERERDKLVARCGRPIEVVAVSARSRGKKRAVDLKKVRWAADPVALAGDPGIDVLVEVIGGAGDPAKSAVETALAAGKPVVTANKALLGGAWPQACDARRAPARGAQFRGVGRRRHPDREDAARRAQRQFVHPHLRHPQRHLQLHPLAHGGGAHLVRGLPARGAAARLCRGRSVLRRRGPRHRAEACRFWRALPSAPKSIRRRFMWKASRRSRSPISMRRPNSATASSFSASRVRTDAGIEQRVHPTMVPKESAIAQVMGVTNAVTVDADGLSPITLVGPGAGGMATASAVVSDLADIARGVRTAAIRAAGRAHDRGAQGAHAAPRRRLLHPADGARPSGQRGHHRAPAGAAANLARIDCAAPRKPLRRTPASPAIRFRSSSSPMRPPRTRSTRRSPRCAATV